MLHVVLQGTPLYHKLGLDQGIQRGRVIFLEDQYQMRRELQNLVGFFKVTSYAVGIILECWTNFLLKTAEREGREGVHKRWMCKTVALLPV